VPKGCEVNRQTSETSQPAEGRAGGPVEDPAAGPAVGPEFIEGSLLKALSLSKGRMGVYRRVEWAKWGPPPYLPTAEGPEFIEGSDSPTVQPPSALLSDRLTVLRPPSNRLPSTVFRSQSSVFRLPLEARRAKWGPPPQNSTSAMRSSW
jgi:hypothetical protein